MKTFIAILVAFFAAAVYSQLVAKDITAIIERAEELEARGNKIIHEFNNHNKTHLLSALETEVQTLERAIKQFKALDANATGRNAVLNQFEENLLHFENRLEEEMGFVQDVYHFNGTGKSANELVVYGEGLVKLARDEIAKHDAHGHQEVVTIQNEIRLVESLIKDIAANPSARRLEQDEANLVRVELTLRALIARIQHAA